jgi:hypothetical protein
VANQEQPRVDCPSVDAVLLNLKCRDEIIPILRALLAGVGIAWSIESGQERCRMTRWLLTVFIAKSGPSVVSKLIKLAGKGPVAMGGKKNFTVSDFAYGSEASAEKARKKIDKAEIGVHCFVKSSHAAKPT